MKQDNVITLDIRRFGKSLKKYWYILVICIVAGICISVALNFKNASSADKPVQKSEFYKTTGNAYFQKVSYVKVDWGEQEIESQPITTIDKLLLLQQDNARSQHYQDILENCRNLFSYEDIRKEIDDSLESAGYNAMSESDNMSFSYTSEEYFFITLNCQCSVERINYLSELLTKIIMREGQARLGLGQCSIAAYSDIYISQKSNGNSFVRSNKTAAVWLESVNKSSNVNLDGSTKIDVKQMVLIIIAAAALGIVIIAVIAIADKTIVSEKEFGSIGDSPLLGSVDASDVSGTDELLMIRCQNSGKSHVAVVTSTEDQDNVVGINMLVNILEESGIKTEIYNGCNNIKRYLAEINKCDGAIIAAVQDKTKRDDAINIDEVLKLAGIEVIGKIFVIK